MCECAINFLMPQLLLDILPNPRTTHLHWRSPFIHYSKDHATHVMKVLADAARAATLTRFLTGSKRLLQKAVAGYECLLQRLLVGLHRLLISDKSFNHAIQSRGTIGIGSWARRL